MMDVLQWLDLLGVGVFAASGALVASRKEMDIVGFALVGTFTGIGGGTLRDLLIGRTVFWIAEPEYVLVCLAVAGALFFLAPFVSRRFSLLLWADSAGLALFSVTGSAVALEAGMAWPVAITMGVLTATFGGLLRDVVCNEIPLILRKEIYASAAALGAGIHVALHAAEFSQPVPGLAGFLIGFGVRAVSIIYGYSLPTYRSRPGRDYPLE